MFKRTRKMPVGLSASGDQKLVTGRFGNLYLGKSSSNAGNFRTIDDDTK